MTKVCPECKSTYPADVDFCPQDGMKLRLQRTDDQDDMIGRTLDGRWIIEEKIGEGGMGSVYKGSQRSVNRTIAIKTLRASLTDNDEFVDRFFREAKIATTINHPHCVTVLDFGQDPETQELYLAMEFLDGMPLADRMEEGSLSILELIKISIQVSSALAASHANSIIHRDLKPDNVFLVDMSTGDVFAKVLDFGIAKVNDDANQYTRTGQIFGTPDYMSPEQCSGKSLDGRSDLYSLGCILYEITTGHAPFEADNPMAVLMAHMTEIPAPPSSLGIELPPGLELIIMRLLAKEPEDRFEHANALIEALKEVQEQLAGVHAYNKSQGIRIAPAMTSPAGGFERVATPAAAMSAPHTPHAPTSSMEFEEVPPPNKKPLIVIGSLVLLGVVAASAVVVALTMADPPPASPPSPMASEAPTITAPPSALANPVSEPTTPEPVAEPSTPEPAPEDELVFDEPVAEPAAEPASKRKPRRKSKPASAPVVEAKPEAKPEPAPSAKPKPIGSDHDAVQAALDGIGATDKPAVKPKPKAKPKPKPKTKKKSSFGIVDELGL